MHTLLVAANPDPRSLTHYVLGRLEAALLPGSVEIADLSQEGFDPRFTPAVGSADAEPSMRAIAREAGVGIATLYRHFPTRQSLVDAVYQDQVARLTTGARELLGQLAPAAVMRRWMDLFGEWIATKNGMLDTLLAMIESGEIAHAQTRSELLAAITTILDAGRTAGDLRSDVTAEDIAASLIGIFTVAPQPEQEAKANRLLNLLMDGLRPAARPA
ncbi:SbtR family transcriptional regulator [Streptomyces hygroscopicus]|uniref:SbtR family transcriptional regulator n=1 Tax=Streptomyces hygroscopicus TaxID=1912 RepID=UPI002160823B|nr:TetR family transcriptional regulator [Streptomyces hygroscopicus]